MNVIGVRMLGWIVKQQKDATDDNIPKSTTAQKLEVVVSHLYSSSAFLNYWQAQLKLDAPKNDYPRDFDTFFLNAIGVGLYDQAIDVKRRLDAWYTSINRNFTLEFTNEHKEILLVQALNFNNIACLTKIIEALQIKPVTFTPAQKEFLLDQALYRNNIDCLTEMIQVLQIKPDTFTIEQKEKLLNRAYCSKNVSCIMKMIEALIANPNTLTNKQKEMVLRPAIRNYNTDDLKTTITALGPNLDTLKFTIGGLIEEDLGNANQFLINYLPSGGLTVQQSDSSIISE